ncbi:MAG: STAS domain-containing protein [Planctomycetota bacterium]
MSDFDGRLVLARRVSAGNVDTAEATIRPDAITEPECTELLIELTEVIRTISPRVAIGCGRLSHVSSAVLGTMIRVRNRAREKGGGICLFALPPEVQSVISLTRLDSVFPIADTGADAVALLAKAGDD